MIEIENISKVYKLYRNPSDRFKEALSPLGKKYHSDFFALDDISFSVKSGETIGIVGKNGSGKSTLLKIITGVLTPSSGEVKVGGKISALLELGAGFNPDYTGLENIYFNGMMMGFTRAEIDGKVNDIIEFADIGEFIHQPVKTYSSGMFVRLAFAVSINVEPEILIVDEALSVGDIFFQAKCYKKFQEFKKMGKTIVFVTHDMSSIIKYCDRAILLNDGKIIENGNPSYVIDQYKKVLVGLYNNEDSATKIEDAEPGQANWKEKISLNPNYNEYGDKSAEIYDLAILDHNGEITNVIMKDKEFTIKLRVKFNGKINDPIFAFTIKDVKGNDITGTNTMLEEIETGEVSSGSIIEVTFKQVVTLQGGDYLLSLGCTGYKANDFLVYHRLYDIINLHVISNKNSVGFFDMNSKTEVINVTKKDEG